MGIAPLIAMPYDPVSAGAMFFVLAACIAVTLGAVVGNGGFRTRRKQRPQPATDREILVLSTILAVSLIAGVGSNAAFIIGSSVSFADVLDVEKLVVVSNQLYVQRIAEGAAPSPPVLSQALLPFVYLAPAVAGIVFVVRREFRWKLLAIASFLPAAAVTMLQTTKAAVLFAATFWLSGYFATRLRMGKTAVFTRGHLIASAALFAVVTTFFFGVGLARMASTDLSLLNVVFGKLLSAAFSHMTVFSHWLAQYQGQTFDPTMGSYTFAGPLELLGFGKRIPGIFENLVELAIAETSNVYTGFRPLIEDFTIPGALAMLALVGAVGGMGFRLVAAGSWSAVPLLILAYMTIFWTPITWFWIYNSLTATVVAVGVIVFFVRLWRGRRRLAVIEATI
jgi:oligosaccharide repeat unit polymerase